MARYSSWLANAVLLVVCCALVASTTNAVFAALLTPEPVASGAVSARPEAADRRSWEDREVILSRNLFNASLLSPSRRRRNPIEEDEPLRVTVIEYATLGDVDKVRALFVNLKNRFNEHFSKKRTSKREPF